MAKKKSSGRTRLSPRMKELKVLFGGIRELNSSLKGTDEIKLIDTLEVYGCTVACAAQSTTCTTLHTG